MEENKGKMKIKNPGKAIRDINMFERHIRKVLALEPDKKNELKVMLEQDRKKWESWVDITMDEAISKVLNGELIPEGKLPKMPRWQKKETQKLAQKYCVTPAVSYAAIMQTGLAKMMTRIEYIINE